MVGANAGGVVLNDTLVKEFRQRWESLGGLFFRARNESEMLRSIRQAWDALVAADVDGSATVVYWPETLGQTTNWSAAIPASVISWDGSMQMREITETAALGITGVEWAVAATGSIALYSKPQSGLLPSVLPPVHLAILRASDIVTTVAEGLRRVPRAPTPPLIKIVTGPSMTADIEGTLVTGVHGPGRVGVIVQD